MLVLGLCGLDAEPVSALSASVRIWNCFYHAMFRRYHTSRYHQDIIMISDSMVESVLHPGEVGATTSMAGGP